MNLKERLEWIWNNKPCLSPCHRIAWHLRYEKKGHKVFICNGDWLWWQKGQLVVKRKYLFKNPK